MKTRELITFKEATSILKHKTELDIINAHILEAIEKGHKWAIIPCDHIPAEVEEELIIKGYRWQWHSETKTEFHEHRGGNQGHRTIIIRKNTLRIPLFTDENLKVQKVGYQGCTRFPESDTFTKPFMTKNKG